MSILNWNVCEGVQMEDEIGFNNVYNLCDLYNLYKSLAWIP